MSLLLEFIHEHALSIDFAMFVIIGLVQVIVCRFFVKSRRTSLPWHPRYCNQIGWFVFLMLCNCSTASAVFVSDNLWN